MHSTFRYTTTFHMKCSDVVGRIQSCPVGYLVSWSVNAVGHIVFTAINQFHRGLDALGNDSCFNNEMAISPPAKSTTHPGQLDINFIGSYTQPGSNSRRNEIRRLCWSHKKCLIGCNVGKTADGLHRIVCQERRRIGLFQDGMRLCKRPFRITILTQHLSGFGCSGSHGFAVSGCAFQSGWNDFFPFIPTKTSHHFF